MIQIVQRYAYMCADCNFMKRDHQNCGNLPGNLQAMYSLQIDAIAINLITVLLSSYKQNANLLYMVNFRSMQSRRHVTPRLLIIHTIIMGTRFSTIRR